MGLKQVELVMERRQIDALIKFDPVEITFWRKPRIDTNDGAWKFGTAVPILVERNGELRPQVATLIPFKRRMTEFLVNTELGDVPDLPYVLVGYPDMDIQKMDTFLWRGDKFQVETVDLKTEVRVAAHIDYFGGNPNG